MKLFKKKTKKKKVRQSLVIKSGEHDVMVYPKASLLSSRLCQESKQSEGTAERG